MSNDTSPIEIECEIRLTPLIDVVNGDSGTLMQSDAAAQQDDRLRSFSQIFNEPVYGLFSF